MTQPVVIPVGDTDRLRLRGIVESDLPAKIAFFTSDRTALMGGAVSEQEVRGIHDGTLKNWATRLGGRFGEMGEIVGHTVGVWRYPEAAA